MHVLGGSSASRGSVWTPVASGGGGPVRFCGVKILVHFGCAPILVRNGPSVWKGSNPQAPFSQTPRIATMLPPWDPQGRGTSGRGSLPWGCRGSQASRARWTWRTLAQAGWPLSCTSVCPATQFLCRWPLPRPREGGGLVFGGGRGPQRNTKVTWLRKQRIFFRPFPSHLLSNSPEVTMRKGEWGVSVLSEPHRLQCAIFLAGASATDGVVLASSAGFSAARFPVTNESALQPQDGVQRMGSIRTMSATS